MILDAVRCRVRGRVQGVYFRESTRRIARSLGLTGHAVNLADGSVEVVACGTEQALADLKLWLAQGPQMARVGSVECEPTEPPSGSDFRTG